MLKINSRLNLNSSTLGISESKGGNLRSKMLKKVMPKLSGERGKALEKAFAENDSDAIKKIMIEITNELATLHPKK